MRKTGSALRMLQRYSLTNTRFLRAPPKQREQNGRERRNCWAFCVSFTRKCLFVPLSSARSARNKQQFENAPKSHAHEHVWFCAHRPKRRENDDRESRRRERRSFGAYCVSFTQQCLVVPLSSGKSAQTRQFFENAPG